MLERYFKKASEKFAEPFIYVLIKLKVKPNTVSFIGLLVILLGSYFFYESNINLGIVFIFLGSAIDGLDGPYARKTNLSSNKGAVLDSFIDRVGELIIWGVVGISYTSNPLELFTIFSIVVGSNIIPYMRAKSELHGIDNKYGIAARPERVLFAIFFMYFNFDFVFVYLFTFLVWLTAIQRFLHLYNSLDS